LCVGFGLVSPKHLARYVDEASFRLNEGNCEVDTIDRMESLVRQMPGARLPWRRLIASNGKPVVPLKGAARLGKERELQRFCQFPGDVYALAGHLLRYAVQVVRGILVGCLATGVGLHEPASVVGTQ